MSETTVQFVRTDSIGSIVLCRPPANSYDIGFMQDLSSAIDGANADGAAKVILIRSSLEKFFSGGADIKAFQRSTLDENMQMVRVAHRALGKMAASPKVFIAAIAGHALGGGFEIALACDLRFAAEGDYRIGLPEVTLGLLPGNGGTQRLPRLIGGSKALELMLTGTTLTPKEAGQLGLVNGVFPADALQQEVEKLAQRLASGASLAVSHIKKAVYEGTEMNLARALEREGELLKPLFESQDAREGIAAFVEKRRPVFRGR